MERVVETKRVKMNKPALLKDLTKLANHLDNIGKCAAATQIDNILKRAAKVPLNELEGAVRYLDRKGISFTTSHKDYTFQSASGWATNAEGEKWVSEYFEVVMEEINAKLTFNRRVRDDGEILTDFEFSHVVPDPGHTQSEETLRSALIFLGRRWEEYKNRLP